MTRALFAVLDRVQEHWPRGASLLLVGLETPPAWALDAAQRIASSWTREEMSRYRASLPALTLSLGLLCRRWAVAAALAVILAAVVVVAAMPMAMFGGTAGGVLAGILSAILLPPLAICNGIACDYVAARALLAVCSGAVRQVQ